jgi:hypothetical protein
VKAARPIGASNRKVEGASGIVRAESLKRNIEFYTTVDACLRKKKVVPWVLSVREAGSRLFASADA